MVCLLVFLFTKVGKVNIVEGSTMYVHPSFPSRNYSTEVDKIWYELSTKVVYFSYVLVHC